MALPLPTSRIRLVAGPRDHLAKQTLFGLKSCAAKEIRTVEIKRQKRTGLARRPADSCRSRKAVVIYGFKVLM